MSDHTVVETAFRAYLSGGKRWRDKDDEDNSWERFRELLKAAEEDAHPMRAVAAPSTVTIRQEVPIPPALVPPGWVEEEGRYFFLGVEKTTVERLRADLEALSDADYLETLPRRCLGCGSKDLPCHCGRVVEARASDGDLVPDSRGYLDEPTITRTNEETDI